MTEKKSDKKPWIIAATKIKEAASSFSYKQKKGFISQVARDLEIFLGGDIWKNYGGSALLSACSEVYIFGKEDYIAPAIDIETPKDTNLLLLLSDASLFRLTIQNGCLNLENDIGKEELVSSLIEQGKLQFTDNPGKLVADIKKFLDHLAEKVMNPDDPRK